MADNENLLDLNIIRYKDLIIVEVLHIDESLIDEENYCRHDKTLIDIPDFKIAITQNDWCSIKSYALYINPKEINEKTNILTRKFTNKNTAVQTCNLMYKALKELNRRYKCEGSAE